MSFFVRLHNAVFHGIQRAFDGWLLSTLARLVFAGVLLVYFLNSARTKLGDGIMGVFELSTGAYAQILPKAFEAVQYDPAALSTLQKAIVYAGTYAEILLPIFIVIGLFTRLSALGMIGFTLVMSYVDVVGHGADAATIGAWFDAQSGSAILDQRSLWILLFAVLVIKGPGPLSLDALFGRSSAR
ncbi:MAG: DoxX family protein [Devosia sp.]